jgi:hypothetical protein
MINTPAWFIGLITLWILLTFIGNVIEKQDILTSTQVMQIQTMSKAETVTTKDPDTGAASTFGNLNYGIVEGLWKALVCDFTWMYDVDPVTHVKTPNDYFWIWAGLYYGVMVGIAVGLVLTIRYKT